MTKLLGRFKRAEETDADGKISTEWASRATVTISLIEGQDVAVSKGGPVVKEFPKTIIVLDDEGRIPEGTEITGNDALWPEGTIYEISIDDGWTMDSLANLWGYAAIEGTEVDLSALELDPFCAGARSPHQPSPVPFPAPIPTPRTPPSSRKPETCHSGFVGGIISPPPTIGVCTLPEIDAIKGPFGRKPGEFGVYSFMLPFRAIVSRVSIKVETPQPGKHVLIGLYDAAGNKVCAARIDASKADVVTGEFGGVDPILPPGEYWLAYAGGQGTKLSSIGERQGQFDLGNAAGGAIVLGTATVPDGTSTFPDKLGRILPSSSFVPPLTWFKA